MITFPYSSPLHLHVILIHIIQPTTHKTLLVACKEAKRIKMFGNNLSIIILLCIFGKTKVLFEEQPFDIISKVKF